MKLPFNNYFINLIAALKYEIKYVINQTEYCQKESV